MDRIQSELQWILDKQRTTPKNKFSKEEDHYLFYLVQIYGTSNWTKISLLMKSRSPRQCRDRWNNYISPNLKQTAWTREEDQAIIEFVKENGNKWAKISERLQNRGTNSIKNRYLYLMRAEKRRDFFNSIEMFDCTPLTCTNINTNEITNGQFQQPLHTQQSTINIINVFEELPIDYETWGNTV